MGVMDRAHGVRLHEWWQDQAEDGRRPGTKTTDQGTRDQIEPAVFWPRSGRNLDPESVEAVLEVETGTGLATLR